MILSNKYITDHTYIQQCLQFDTQLPQKSFLTKQKISGYLYNEDQ